VHPTHTGTLTSLVELDAASNQLAALPDSTSSLKALRTLQLDDNR
jgi:Leucine-rich repeat (LRR) protein